MTRPTTSDRDDAFELYDLRVEVVATDRPMVCSHRAGDWFMVQGENLVFSGAQSFSMYSLAALLPLLPAKQRQTHPHHWMPATTDRHTPRPLPVCPVRL